jgi:glycosyltransferase involved in cell wall biosynthesis
VPYLIGQLEEECFVYYCVDEYRLYRGFQATAIAAAENDLIKRADVVITTSESLHRTKRAQRSDTVLVRHGVDFDHFATAWRRQLPRPADLTAIAGPIFGFFGLIHDWVDLKLLSDVAKLRPRYSFVLIGDHRVDVAEIKRLDNVHLLGRRAYDDLPAYCAAFEAGLLLFRRTAMTRNVNPIKMHEYLAAGLPVVSTPLPEAERYRGPVTIANTPPRFAAACDHVVATDHPGRRELISRYVENETWQSKVEHLSRVIMPRTAPPLRTASMPAESVVAPARRQRSRTATPAP